MTAIIIPLRRVELPSDCCDVVEAPPPVGFVNVPNVKLTFRNGVVTITRKSPFRYDLLILAIAVQAILMLGGLALLMVWG